ncbi:hypothetical protein [Ureibacillus acetophenoni]
MHKFMFQTVCDSNYDKFRYNVQAMNYSKIKLKKTIIENKLGEVFYSENNSLITTTMDEVDS